MTPLDNGLQKRYESTEQTDLSEARQKIRSQWHDWTGRYDHRSKYDPIGLIVICISVLYVIFIIKSYISEWVIQAVDRQLRTFSSYIVILLSPFVLLCCRHSPLIARYHIAVRIQSPVPVQEHEQGLRRCSYGLGRLCDIKYARGTARDVIIPTLEGLKWRNTVRVRIAV